MQPNFFSLFLNNFFFFFFWRIIEKWKKNYIKRSYLVCSKKTVVEIVIKNISIELFKRNTLPISYSLNKVSFFFYFNDFLVTLMMCFKNNLAECSTINHLMKDKFYQIWFLKAIYHLARLLFIIITLITKPICLIHISQQIGSYDSTVLSLSKLNQNFLFCDELHNSGAPHQYHQRWCFFHSQHHNFWWYLSYARDLAI